MARTRLGILRMAAPLALFGLVFATLAVSDPLSRLPVVLLGTLGVILTAVLARFQTGAERVVFLRDLMLLGLAVRFLVFGVIHQTVGPYVFAPDQYTYESWGMGILRHFTVGTAFPGPLQQSFQVGYPGLNALLFAVFGEARAAPAMVNMTLSVWTAVPLYHLTLHLTRGAERVAGLAAGLTLFFPSLVLWSTLNIREAPTILFIVLAVYFFVRVQARADATALAGVVVSLALLTLFREYLTSLVGIAGAAGVVIGQSRAPLRSLAAGMLLIVSLTFVAQNLGLGQSLVGEPSLERAQLIREGFQIGAGSAYGQGADISTPGGALRYMPVGLAYFLLAPFPWDIGSLLQAITLPETLLWWALVPFVVRGGVRALREDPGSYTVPVAVLTLITFAYALVESNVGTAYRHRGQILPLAFVFCALGLEAFLRRRREKRERMAERRRRAAEMVQVPFPAGRR